MRAEGERFEPIDWIPNDRSNLKRYATGHASDASAIDNCMHRIDPALVEAIQAAPGTIPEIAARFGISASSVSRIRPRRGLSRLTDDQVIEVYTSTETDKDIAKRFGVSLAHIIAIRTRFMFATVTAGLPDRPRGRAVNRPIAVIENERSERQERVRRRAERNATILSSREPGYIIARQLGITPQEVSRVRRVGGWVAPPKPPKPVKVKPRRMRPPKPPTVPKLKPLNPPKPKPVKPEPRESKWEPALSTMSRSWEPPLPAPPHPRKIDKRAVLKRFIAKHPELSNLALSARLDLRFPWLTIIRAMPRPTGPAGPMGPREHKQVGPAVRIKPGYLRARDPRAIVCRFYSVADRPEATGLGEPL